MKQFLVTLERIVTVVQAAEVTILAPTEEDAEDAAYDVEPDWRTVKIIDSNGTSVHVEEGR